MNDIFRIMSLILCASMLAGCLSACGRKNDQAQTSTEPAAEVSDAQPEQSQQSNFDSVFTLDYDPAYTLNPLSSGSNTNLTLMPLIFEGLFQVNENFSFTNVLCSNYTTQDGINFEFSIKTGVTMHDGSELSISDVIYSINLARNSSLYSSRLEIISAVYANNGNVRIELNRPNYNFPALLDIPVMKDGTGDDDMPIGTGPYYFVIADGYSYLKAFDGYRDYSSLPLDRFYLKNYTGDALVSAFENGSIDLVTSAKSRVNYLEFGGGTEVRYKGSTDFHYIGINSESYFMSYPEHRLLISSAIDREYIASEIIGGDAATLPLSTSAYFYSDKFDSYTSSPSQLKSLEEKYKVEDYDNDGVLEYTDPYSGVCEFSLTMIVNKENPAKLAAAHYIVDELNKDGFNITLKELEWSEFLYTLNKGDYDLYYGEVMLGSDFDLTPIFSYGGKANYGIYDKTLQSYVYDFNSAPFTERTEKAKQLYDYIAQTIPVISLAFEKDTVYTHRGVVSGMSPAVHNLFNNITQWQVNLS